MRPQLVLVFLASLAADAAADAAADSSPTSTCTPDVAPGAVPATPQSVTTSTSTEPTRPVYFDLRAGAFEAQRNMSLSADPDASSFAPDYPRQPFFGVAVHGGIYARAKKLGLGATVDAATSLRGTLTAMDDTGSGDYYFKYTALEAAAHYRQPIGDRITVDGALLVGRTSYTIPDLPTSIQIPDTTYVYAGGGIGAEATVGRGITFGAGARYQRLLSAGDITAEDWYGAGTGRGLSLTGEVTIPLTDALYARAAVGYQDFTIEFVGNGMLAEEYGAWSMQDTQVSGTAQVGASF